MKRLALTRNLASFALAVSAFFGPCNPGSPLAAQAQTAPTATVTATTVQDARGGPLVSGQFCFGATCLPVKGGSLSGSRTVPQGTANITVTDGFTSIVTVLNVQINASTFSWDAFVLASTQTAFGPTPPILAAAVGAHYIQTYSNLPWLFTATDGP